MRAAVVTSFDAPPAYGEFAAPPERPGEVRIAVRAAALSNLVRAQAAGKHYSATVAPPVVPGVDGVGRLPGGERVYFAFPEAPFGSMAETVSLDAALTVPVPDGLDDVTAAAAGNPGMSSMIAFRHRLRFERGESVLINGATGTSGRLAVAVARALGARTIVATGRDPVALDAVRALGADIVIPLGGPPEDLVRTLRREMRAHGVSVVLDYLYGPPAAAIVAAIAAGASRHAEPRVRFVNIGSSAGTTIELPAGSLRASGLEMLGSGLGSVSYDDIIASIGEFFTMFVHDKFSIDTRTLPLERVADAWADRSTKARTVLTIGA